MAISGVSENQRHKGAGIEYSIKFLIERWRQTEREREGETERGRGREWR